MRPRHPSAVPIRWLMTDHRMGGELWRAIARLPRGGGIVFRHYGLSRHDRRALFGRVLWLARRRELIVLRAGHTRMRGEMGVHNAPGHGLRTRAVHNAREARRACRLGVDAVFLSPVHDTRSHPGARALGVRRARAIAAALPVPVIALGGMNERRFRRLGPTFHGWAGIDAWLA